MNISPALAGIVTIIFWVAFGTFLYPILFKRRSGVLIVAVLTAALVVVFYVFGTSTGTAPMTAALLACVWAGLPLFIARIVHRLQSRGEAPTKNA